MTLCLTICLYVERNQNSKCEWQRMYESRVQLVIELKLSWCWKKNRNTGNNTFLSTLITTIIFEYRGTLFKEDPVSQSFSMYEVIPLSSEPLPSQTLHNLPFSSPLIGHCIVQREKWKWSLGSGLNFELRSSSKRMMKIRTSTKDEIKNKETRTKNWEINIKW